MFFVRSISLLAVLVSSPVAVLAASESEPMHFSSQEIELPSSDRTFPDGPGAEAINNNCLACHSAGMVLTQPKLTKAQWTETVNKMAKVYHAPISPEDSAAIIDYLTNLKPQP
ncbi:cytochrome c [Methylobacterium sp. C25]|uniref:c-type cytochrome n=1 Tax=Methylobacterium sp. C25 TaxID=2721622 RepID=UPI001F3CE915|nr:cytochrome c [Methylobacterium sp. C25]MCE4224996.1 cytochrome c [Methylobacterium sp. C25]